MLAWNGPQAWPRSGGHWQQELLGPPGRVGEHDGPLLGPAGEHSLLGNEAMGAPRSLLVQTVHLALVQPALLEVVVGHGARALLTVGRGQGQVDWASAAQERDSHICTDGRGQRARSPLARAQKLLLESWVTLDLKGTPTTDHLEAESKDKLKVGAGAVPAQLPNPGQAAPRAHLLGSSLQAICDHFSHTLKTQFLKGKGENLGPFPGSLVIVILKYKNCSSRIPYPYLNSQYLSNITTKAI